ncbi:peptidoglycan-associated lipoprotein Pal [Allopseudospirillum japonicum]|nr:peptidoglycan-associated lipoprotein Pal [Allopseudospirillum japonicum]
MQKNRIIANSSAWMKPLAAGLLLAVMAGCASQPQSGMQPVITDDQSTATTGTGDGSAQSQGLGTYGSGGAQGLNSGQNAGVSGMPGANPADADLLAKKRIFFDFDKSEIRKEYLSVLNAHAAYLVANPNVKLVLEGHCDQRGTREYNMALGERRGDSVQRYLTVQGVSPQQLEVVSYGEERPLMAGHSLDAYAKNRRVELSYR